MRAQWFPLVEENGGRKIARIWTAEFQKGELYEEERLLQRQRGLWKSAQGWLSSSL